MPENGFRSYNFALTVRYILITLLVTAVAFSALYAIVSNVDVNLKPINNESAEWEQRDISSGSSSTKLSDGKTIGYDAAVKEDAGKTGVAQIISYVVVIGAGLVILGIWLRKKNLLRRIFTILSVIWQSFFEFITAVFELIGQIGVKDKYDIPLTFVDTEEAIDYADYSAEYSEYKGLEYLSIKEFDEILNKKESFEEKYAYAYSTYCNLIRIGDNGIKRSDTPRVLTQKLKAQRKADLEKATPVYEEIRYRLVKPSNEPGKGELKELVRLVHSLLRTQI